MTHGSTISLNLQKAQKQLKQANREADQLRKTHLEALLNQATAANPQKKSKALTYLIQAERNQQYYAKFWQHTKPKSKGSLAFMTVTTEDSHKKPLLDQTELEDTLLEHSCTHFAQAEGLQFTQEPLGQLLSKMTV